MRHAAATVTLADREGNLVPAAIEYPKGEKATNEFLGTFHVYRQRVKIKLRTDVAVADRVLTVRCKVAGYDRDEDFRDAYESHPDKPSVLGYCFYHGQDLESAVRGDGLCLAFGPVNPREENTQGPVVGKVVQEELERVGLKVQWDGTFNESFTVPQLVWQRR